MAKKFLMLICALALVFLLTNMGSAAEFLGEHCWQKTPYPDIVKLSVSLGGSQYEVHGVQIAESYTIPVVGNGFVSGGTGVLGLTYIGNLSQFSGTTGMSEYVVLSLDTLNATGASTLVSYDGLFEDSDSTWVKVSCPLTLSDITAASASGTPQGAN